MLRKAIDDVFLSRNGFFLRWESSNEQLMLPKKYCQPTGFSSPHTFLLVTTRTADDEGCMGLLFYGTVGVGLAAGIVVLRRVARRVCNAFHRSHPNAFSQFLAQYPELLLPELTPTDRALLARTNTISRTAVAAYGLPRAGHLGSGGEPLELRHFVSSVEMLKWAMKQRKSCVALRKWEKNTGRGHSFDQLLHSAGILAAREGHVEVLAYCFSQPCSMEVPAGARFPGRAWGDYVTRDGLGQYYAMAAIEGGHLETLSYLRAHCIY